MYGQGQGYMYGRSKEEIKTEKVDELKEKKAKLTKIQLQTDSGTKCVKLVTLKKKVFVLFHLCLQAILSKEDSTTGQYTNGTIILFTRKRTWVNTDTCLNSRTQLK